MAKLYKTSLSETDAAELLADKLIIASSFFKRGIGLLGKDSLKEGEAIWIKPGNNAHTWFMKFNLDFIFVNQKLEIKYLVSDVGSFRFIGPYWKSTSFFELPAGFIQMKKLNVGDLLYVVD